MASLYEKAFIFFGLSFLICMLYALPIQILKKRGQYEYHKRRLLFIRDQLTILPEIGIIILYIGYPLFLLWSMWTMKNDANSDHKENT